MLWPPSADEHLYVEGSSSRVGDVDCLAACFKKWLGLRSGLGSPLAPLGWNDEAWRLGYLVITPLARPGWNDDAFPRFRRAVALRQEAY